MEKLSEKLRRQREERLQAIYGEIKRAEWMQVEKEARHLARILSSFRHYTPEQTALWYDELKKYRPAAAELKNFEAMLEAVRVDLPRLERESMLQKKEENHE